MAPAATIETNFQDRNSILTPEKLAIMRLSSTFDRDVFSEPGSPLLGAKQLNFESRDGGAGRAHSVVARGNRHFSSSTRRSFLRSHKKKMSTELTTQAEAKFFSLMEFMSSASREAGALKNYWAQLMAERESFAAEREELISQIDAATEGFERAETQHHSHKAEIAERKKEVEKLLIELSVALNAVTEHKKKAIERDDEIQGLKTELQTLKLTGTRTNTDYEKVRADFESLTINLKQAEAERDHARADADRHRSDIRSLTRENSDLKARTNDFNIRHEDSRREVSILVERIKAFDIERDGHQVEKDRHHDELRKATIKVEEVSRELGDLNDRNDRLRRDVQKQKETIGLLESERDDNKSTIERLRLEVKTVTANLDDSETRNAEASVKYEKVKRELAASTDRNRELENEVNELRRALDQKNEDHRLVVIERDQVKDDLEDERRKVHDKEHIITGSRDSLHRAETTLNEVRFEVTTLKERITSITAERDDAVTKHQPLVKEISELTERISALQRDLNHASHSRDRLRKELHDVQQKYSEITETITEYESGSNELEFEIENLRALLRDAREQKERAIAARTTADRERDEYVAKYEEKCREYERREEARTESRALQYREHSHGGFRTMSSRTITKSSGAAAAESFEQGEEMETLENA